MSWIACLGLHSPTVYSPQPPASQTVISCQRGETGAPIASLYYKAQARVRVFLFAGNRAKSSPGPVIAQASGEAPKSNIT